LSGPAHHLALYNFGLHVAEHGDPAVSGFVQREPFNFEAARRAAGFVGRSGYDGEPGPGSWGRQVFPRFIEGSGRDSGPSSLSLWRDIESLMAFSYFGVHADALKHARRWNVAQTWPPLVLFWVEEGQIPDWAEGVSRLEALADRGSTVQAFTFKQAFDPQGAPYRIDRDRVKRIATDNMAGQRDLMEIVKTLPF
jgi:hypothetical protein